MTPHVAGVSRPKDIAESFLNNWNREKKGEDLVGVPATPSYYNGLRRFGDFRILKR